jgi:hypothetical protein
MSDIRTMVRFCLPALFFILLAAPVSAYVIHANPDDCWMRWGSADFGWCDFGMTSVLNNDYIFDDIVHWPPLDLPLSAVQVSQARYGCATISGNGFVGYYPFDRFFTGTDEAKYRACYQDTCSNGIVWFFVLKSWYAKDAADDQYTTPADTPLVVAVPGVRANDDCGAFELEPYVEYESRLMTEPEHGSLTFSHNGAFEYVPDPGFTGTDSFTYRLFMWGDPEHFGDPATVTITVSSEIPVPEFPSCFVPAMVVAGICSCILAAVRKPS